MDIKMMIKLLSKRKQLRLQEHWTREQLDAYQTHELHKLRQYAYAHSPFYKEFHKGLYNAPLHELPVLTKAMLMEHFDDVVTDPSIHLQAVKEYMANKHNDERFLGHYWVNSTSGSSGHPGLFLANLNEWTTMLASALRGFEGAGMKLKLTHRTKMTQITSTNSSHMSSQGGKSMGNWWMPMQLLSAGEPIKTLVDKLNAWQPEILLGYASIIRILADEQLSGRLQINPRTVISGSEVLTQETRNLSQRAWGNVLFNMYGTTDCGGIGAECNKHMGMHILEDLIIVEVVDRNNNPVPNGTYGDKVLVTVLGSRTQPLIRYELDDSIRLSSHQCSCGRPFRLIDDIQGRVHEILSFLGESGGIVTVHPIVFHNIIDTLPVTGWQIVQEVDALHVLLSGVQGLLDETKLKNTLEQGLAKQKAIVPPIIIRQVTSIPQALSGKTPLIKSNLPHNQ